MFNAALFPIVAAIAADIIAQVLKVPFAYIANKKWDLLWVFASGGFPSSHSAMVTALMTAIALQEGITSTVFAVTFIFGLIVMYDACHVRYYSGKGIALTQQLVRDLSERHVIDLTNPVYQEKMKTVLGHRVREVLGGVLAGICIALTVAFVFGVL